MLKIKIRSDLQRRDIEGEAHNLVFHVNVSVPERKCDLQPYLIRKLFLHYPHIATNTIP